MSQLEKKLDALLEKLGATEPEAKASSWGKQEPVEIPSFVGVAVPIRVETPIGKVRCYLTLPPEAAADEETLVASIGRLKDMGMFIDAYQGDQGRAWNGGGNGWRNRPYRNNYGGGLGGGRGYGRGGW